MATKRKNNKKPGKAAKITLRVFAALLLVLAALAGIGVLNANVVRIRRAEVMLSDLPEAFDGVSMLYASDIDLMGINTPEKAGALLNSLQSLKPDVLLLGGDYNASPLREVLNRTGESDAALVKKRKARTDFFHYIKAFDAPLGKYAIAAPEDPDWEDLSAAMREGGVKPLFNQRAELRRDGAAIYLAGICEESASLNSAGATFSRGDCVLTVAYSPAVLPILLTSEAADGGQWSDLVLCGHTHGGQVRLFGRSALPLQRQEQQSLAGWSMETGLPILVTQGVGCEGLNLRLGSRPEVWLITLRRA